MLDIRDNPSEMYMYGELNNKIKKILPKGLDTQFTEVIIDNQNYTIQVNLKEEALRALIESGITPILQSYQSQIDALKAQLDNMAENY